MLTLANPTDNQATKNRPEFDWGPGIFLISRNVPCSGPAWLLIADTHLPRHRDLACSGE
jgi:hypothetical protein